MIQISDCAQISREHSLQAAIIMLSAVRRRLRDTDFRPRFVLVHDDQYQIVGVLRQGEILHALAKNAKKTSMTLAEMIAMAPRITAGDAMIPYGKAGSIEADAPVEEAIEKMLDGPFRHLLVTDGDTTVGIVRLSEIFAIVTQNVFRTVQD
jgi:CBS domain containing-hemolysin-like protein